MSRRGAAPRADVRAARDAARPATPPAPSDAERERHLEKKLTVLTDLLPLLRVLRQRVEAASGGASDATP